MKIRTIFLLFVLILMAVFLVINWTAVSYTHLTLPTIA